MTGDEVREHKAEEVCYLCDEKFNKKEINLY